MIEVLEAKDMKWIMSRFEEVKERTLRHTEQIKELQKQMKELKNE